jgi:hypothetical protein
MWQNTNVHQDTKGSNEISELKKCCRRRKGEANELAVESRGDLVCRKGEGTLCNVTNVCRRTVVNRLSATKRRL